MKAYSQLLREFPSKKVVLAFGDFQTPSTSHELLIKTVQKVANEQVASHFICVSNESTKLPVDRKTYYVNRMFPESTIMTAESLVEAAAQLNKKYKDLVVVAGSDQIVESKKLLESHNGTKYSYNSITVLSSGERNADSDTTMFKLAKKGEFDLFKESAPTQLTTLDAKRLMNELREQAGIDPIKNEPKIATDWLRESYYRGEIYKIGEIVESNGQKFEIVDRGNNYLVVADNKGDTHRKWITDVTPSTKEVVEEQLEENQMSYKGYTTKNFNEETFMSFKQMINKDEDPVAVLNAIKTADVELASQKITEMTFTAGDKIKVARIIASSLGVVSVEKTSSPEGLVNNALRKIRNKPLRPEYIAIVNNMLQTAREAGIQYDEKLVPKKMEIKEVSSELLDRYKDKAKKSADDLASKGQYKKSTDRWMGVMKATGKQIDKTTAGIKKSLNKEGYQSHSGPSHGHAYGGTGFGKRPREDDEYHVPDPVAKDHPHAVHIDGKKWKTFGSESHASNVAKKIKNATVHKEEVALDEISQKLAGDYYGAATKKHLDKVGVKPNMYDRIEKDMGKQRKAGVDRALDRVMGARKTNEEVVDEAHKLGDKVIMTKGPKDVVGKTGHVGEIRKRWAGDTKTYTIDHEDGSIQLKPTHFKKFKEEVELEEDIKKEYDSLKKHDIKTLRGFIKGQHKIVDTSEFKTKDHAISHYLRNKHGNKKVADAFGLKEESSAEKEDSIPNILNSWHNDPKSFNSEIADMKDVEHILPAYEDKELGIIDDETGEHLSHVHDEPSTVKTGKTVDQPPVETDEYMASRYVKEEVLDEALSRMERIRRKARFVRTKSKREVRTKIALRKSSNLLTFNKRAKRLAMNMIKTRLLRKDPSTASLAEKERVEKFIHARHPLVDRLARRLVPKVRQIEKARLHHKKYTNNASGTPLGN
jgi:hypothetical protein